MLWSLSTGGIVTGLVAVVRPALPATTCAGGTGAAAPEVVGAVEVEPDAAVGAAGTVRRMALAAAAGAVEWTLLGAVEARLRGRQQEQS